VIKDEELSLVMAVHIRELDAVPVKHFVVSAAPIESAPW
jgi:hypothetical protein